MSPNDSAKSGWSTGLIHLKVEWRLSSPTREATSSRFLPRSKLSALPSHRPKPTLRLPPKLGRCHALEFQEAAVEVGHVAEADLVADVGDVVLGLHEQVAGVVDAHAVHEVGEAVAGGAVEEAAEAALTHAQFVRHVG